MKVALITGGLKLGGSTTFLCNFGDELVRRHIPVYLWSFEAENPLAADFERLKIPVACQCEHRSIFEDRLLAILREIREFKPTVVIANLSAQSFEVLRYVPPGVFRVGVAHADHNNVYDMVRHYSRELDLMVAVSDKIRDRLQTVPGFERLRILYLPLGVPVPTGNLKQKLFEGPLQILYLGRLDREQKRVHLFPAIYEQLKSSGIPFHWTIAGTGPEQSNLERELRSAGPSQTISFPGKIPYSQVLDLLLKHDIFLLASDYEGLPLGLLEAMGCGLVPVVSDLPSGIRELVDETTGRRVAPDDLKGYTDAIVSLHGHRDELRRCSEAARQKVVGQFSTSAMADRWLKWFPEGSAESIWPARFTLRAPLASDSQWRFSPPVRILRRLLFKLQRRASEPQMSTP